MMQTLKSPCVDICALDLRAGLCTGCGRTLTEIAEWGDATAERQRAILAMLPKRLELLGAGLPITL